MNKSVISLAFILFATLSKSTFAQVTPTELTEAEQIAILFHEIELLKNRVAKLEAQQKEENTPASSTIFDIAIGKIVFGDCELSGQKLICKFTLYPDRNGYFRVSPGSCKAHIEGDQLTCQVATLGQVSWKRFGLSEIELSKDESLNGTLEFQNVDDDLRSLSISFEGSFHEGGMLPAMKKIECEVKDLIVVKN